MQLWSPVWPTERAPKLTKRLHMSRLVTGFSLGSSNSSSYASESLLRGFVAMMSGVSRGHSLKCGLTACSFNLNYFIIIHIIISLYALPISTYIMSENSVKKAKLKLTHVPKPFFHFFFKFIFLFISALILNCKSSDICFPPILWVNLVVLLREYNVSMFHFFSCVMRWWTGEQGLSPWRWRRRWTEGWGCDSGSSVSPLDECLSPTLGPLLSSSLAEARSEDAQRLLLHRHQRDTVQVEISLPSLNACRATNWRKRENRWSCPP